MAGECNFQAEQTEDGRYVPCPVHGRGPCPHPLPDVRKDVPIPATAEQLALHADETWQADVPNVNTLEAALYEVGSALVAAIDRNTEAMRVLVDMRPWVAEVTTRVQQLESRSEEFLASNAELLRMVGELGARLGVDPTRKS